MRTKTTKTASERRGERSLVLLLVSVFVVFSAAASPAGAGRVSGSAAAASTAAKAALASAELRSQGGTVLPGADPDTPDPGPVVFSSPAAPAACRLGAAPARVLAVLRPAACAHAPRAPPVLA